jgi:hypothetical protein
MHVGTLAQRLLCRLLFIFRTGLCLPSVIKVLLMLAVFR